jgi:hypothetical protein
MMPLGIDSSFDDTKRTSRPLATDLTARIRTWSSTR